MRDLFAKPLFDYPPRTVPFWKAMMKPLPLAGLADQVYTPLVAHMVREYGLVPCSVDSHIGEYLPFALDVGPYHPTHMDFFERFDGVTERLATWVADTSVPLPLQKVGHSLEEVIPIIAARWTGEPARIMAVNVPNRGFLPDVADGAIVEVGATVDGDGIHPEEMPPLGEPLAGWVGTQVALQDLVVRAALERDPDLAYQAVVADPCSPADEAACRALFDELLELQAPELPF